MASLKLKGVRKAVGATPVLDDLSLTLEGCEFIAFLGPSGSGKSTLPRTTPTDDVNTRRIMLIDRIVWRDGWPRIEADSPSAGPRPAPAAAR
ncbi:MAG TPA: ATP-binding cassette domain-containing protein [Sphingomicrobium sp.]|nr:ATP-binding cassette domain-containing protein [Sphingomicrobium sp.]